MIMTQQVAIFLASQISSLTFGLTDKNSNVYLNNLPPDKPVVTSIFTFQVSQANNIKGFRSVGVKIIYRGNNNLPESEEKAQEIFDILQYYEKGYFLLGENYIVSSIAQGSMGSMGYDNNNFHEFVMRFTIEYKE